MKFLSAIVVAMLAVPPALARSVDVCPTLPADTHVEWIYNEGPDFDVCYAHPTDSDETIFGVYLGNHPSFHPKRTNRIGRGKVGGLRMVWYRRSSSDSPAAFDRETLLILDRETGYVAHLWVIAETEQQLQERLSVLERMRFKDP
ncbi:MAG: hypothetical protein DI564_05820 [Rhodanobacter denitrificans]|uniref:Uncharacterized protein n=1 Tax=Rhodanobacter denitrificans TaxID=666685 RepID=A0A2W5KPC9_9GAMM|nr:MAG: hypothetical protein DI564_05820 [Rhodanobacter denitrificans]